MTIPAARFWKLCVTSVRVGISGVALARPSDPGDASKLFQKSSNGPNRLSLKVTPSHGMRPAVSPVPVVPSKPNPLSTEPSGVALGLGSTMPVSVPGPKV